MSVKLTTSPFAILPTDVSRYIFSFCGRTSLARCAQVCKGWNSIAGNLKLWTKETHILNITEGNLRTISEKVNDLIKASLALDHIFQKQEVKLPKNHEKRVPQRTDLKSFAFHQLFFDNVSILFRNNKMGKKVKVSKQSIDKDLLMQWSNVSFTLRRLGLQSLSSIEKKILTIEIDSPPDLVCNVWTQVALLYVSELKIDHALGIIKKKSSMVSEILKSIMTQARERESVSETLNTIMRSLDRDLDILTFISVLNTIKEIALIDEIIRHKKIQNCAIIKRLIIAYRDIDNNESAQFCYKKYCKTFYNDSKVKFILPILISINLEREAWRLVEQFPMEKQTNHVILEAAFLQAGNLKEAQRAASLTK